LLLCVFPPLFDESSSAIRLGIDHSTTLLYERNASDTVPAALLL
jgi:hypothetical protein